MIATLLQPLWIRTPHTDHEHEEETITEIHEEQPEIITYIQQITEEGNLVLALHEEELLEQGFTEGTTVIITMNRKEYEMSICHTITEVQTNGIALISHDEVMIALRDGDFATSSGIAMKEEQSAEPGYHWHYASGIQEPVMVMIRKSQ